MTAWPDMQRPGVPLNPERDGWHWLRSNRDVAPWRWHEGDGEIMQWAEEGGDGAPDDFAPIFHYLGPAMLPSEVAAQIAAAAEAMREAAKGCADQRITSRSYGSHADAYEYISRVIAALPLPSGDALAAAIAQAVAGEREACAKVAEGWSVNHHPKRLATAIRARG